jgi:hypothetical protein
MCFKWTVSELLHFRFEASLRLAPTPHSLESGLRGLAVVVLQHPMLAVRWKSVRGKLDTHFFEWLNPFAMNWEFQS